MNVETSRYLAGGRLFVDLYMCSPFMENSRRKVSSWFWSSVLYDLHFIVSAVVFSVTRLDVVSVYGCCCNG